jgi:hypothetical protein
LFHRAIVAAAGVIAASAAAAQTPLNFALDWRFEGPQRPISSPSTRATSPPPGST